ncbi:MAG: hypothetical protein ACRCZW_11910 [Lactobacillaceae bacterium]
MGQREIILDFINQITVKKTEKAGASKVTLYRLDNHKNCSRHFY